jgi:hypothetical protein
MGWRVGYIALPPPPAAYAAGAAAAGAAAGGAGGEAGAAAAAAAAFKAKAEAEDLGDGGALMSEILKVQVGLGFYCDCVSSSRGAGQRGAALASGAERSGVGRRNVGQSQISSFIRGAGHTRARLSVGFGAARPPQAPGGYRVSARAAGWRHALASANVCGLLPASPRSSFPRADLCSLPFPLPLHPPPP